MLSFCRFRVCGKCLRYTYHYHQFSRTFIYKLIYFITRTLTRNMWNSIIKITKKVIKLPRMLPDLSWLPYFQKYSRIIISMAWKSQIRKKVYFRKHLLRNNSTSCLNLCRKKKLKKFIFCNGLCNNFHWKCFGHIC